MPCIEIRTYGGVVAGIGALLSDDKTIDTDALLRSRWKEPTRVERAEQDLPGYCNVWEKTKRRAMFCARTPIGGTFIVIRLFEEDGSKTESKPGNVPLEQASKAEQVRKLHR